jgi:hypothetical protein
MDATGFAGKWRHRNHLIEENEPFPRSSLPDNATIAPMTIVNMGLFANVDM